MLNIYRRVNPAHAADNKGSRELQHMAGWETQKPERHESEHVHAWLCRDSI